MVRLGAVICALVLVIASAEESAGQTGRLTGLEEIRVVVESLGAMEDKTGLKQGDLTIHVLTVLRNRLPRLVINGTADSFLWVNARLAMSETGGRSNYYYGAIWVGLFRPVVIKKTGLPINAMVWYRASGVEGALEGANGHVRQTLNQIFAHFTTEWMRDNPER